jgi:MFS family permease
VCAEEPKLLGSRRAADADAALTAVMNGLTEPFMIPYVLALGATPFQAGLLSSFRNLVLAGVQLLSPGFVRRTGSRRSLVLWTIALQAALWLPLAFAQPLFGAGAVVAVIVGYTLGSASAMLGGPAWSSLVADYTPPAERGRQFGRRARLAGIAATVAGLAAGGALELNRGNAVTGFAVLCASACLARVASFGAVTRFHDRGHVEEPHARFSFLQFVRATPRSNFARFSMCMSANSLATHVAAPFFAVYLLERAGYSYAEYTLVMLGGALTGMLAGPWWGRIGDRVGNQAVLRWTTSGVALLPALWIAFDHPAWMLGANVAGAFLWGGLSLSATNFLYDAVTPAKRHACVAYFNVLNGLGTSAGALLGGWLVAWAGSEGLTPFYAVFAISAALRLVSAWGFRRFVHEVREVDRIELRRLMGERLIGVLGLDGRPFERRGPQRRTRAPLAFHAVDASKSRAVAGLGEGGGKRAVNM